LAKISFAAPRHPLGDRIQNPMQPIVVAMSISCGAHSNSSIVVEFNAEWDKKVLICIKFAGLTHEFAQYWSHEEKV
jgi:hypothetical protein